MSSAEETPFRFPFDWEVSLYSGGKKIVECPGIGGGFDSELVVRIEVSLCPSGDMFELDTLWLEHNILLGIDGPDHDIVAVQIKTDETGFARNHEIHLRELETGSQTCRMGQDGNRHQFELVAHAKIRAGHPNGRMRACRSVPVAPTGWPDATRPTTSLLSLQLEQG